MAHSLQFSFTKTLKIKKKYILKEFRNAVEAQENSLNGKIHQPDLYDQLENTEFFFSMEGSFNSAL